MTFNFKPSFQTKCANCAHAHIVTTEKSTDPLYICNILGAAVRDIKSCSKFLNVINAPVPIQMAMQAWTVDADVSRTKKTVGFTPPVKTILVAPPEGIEAMPLEVEDEGEGEDGDDD